MARSMGILKASQNGAALQTAAKELIDPQTAGKGIAEIAAELRDILGHMAGSQILIEEAGWILELLENVRYADGWKHPLECCDELIRLAVTHESRTMTVGDVGSKAAAETHRKGLIGLAKSDGKEQESWINDGLLDPMLRSNFGEINEEDKARWRTLLGREIQHEKVTAISMAGVEIDWKTVAEARNVPVLCDSVTGEVLRRQEAQPGEASGADDTEDEDDERDDDEKEDK